MSRDSASEDPVAFAAGGVVLRGMLHRPVGPGMLSGLGVVVVPGGLNRRVGLHRMYLAGARALSRRGAAVLRFDLPGLGDSEGQMRWLTPAALASLDARHADEVGTALDTLVAQEAPRKLVLLGHCHGARSAVLRAATDPRVRAVAAWAMPMGSDASPRPTAWIAEAARRLLERGQPVLWVYGTRDPAWGAFQEFLGALPDVERSQAACCWTTRAIPAANHDFTSMTWTAEVIDATATWMSAVGATAPSESSWTSR